MKKLLIVTVIVAGIGLWYYHTTQVRKMRRLVTEIQGEIREIDATCHGLKDYKPDTLAYLDANPKYKKDTEGLYTAICNLERARLNDTTIEAQALKDSLWYKVASTLKLGD